MPKQSGHSETDHQVHARRQGPNRGEERCCEADYQVPSRRRDPNRGEERCYETDYQVHSLRSHDGRDSIEVMAARAFDSGLAELGFSEHKDFDPADPVADFLDYDAYREEIESARARYRDLLFIRMGVEVDYQRWFERDIAAYLETHAFDFVIGSVHYVDRAMLMTDAYLAGRDMRAAYRDYFRAVTDSVESGLIDIVGHLEYCNRRGVPIFGPYDPAPYREEVERLFDAMIRRGAALEINSAGLRQGAGHTYPCESHVRLYAAMGGRFLTFGSDAHVHNDLSAEYYRTVKIALDAGITEVTVFENRKPRQVPILG